MQGRTELGGRGGERPGPLNVRKRKKSERRGGGDVFEPFLYRLSPSATLSSGGNASTLLSTSTRDLCAMYPLT